MAVTHTGLKDLPDALPREGGLRQTGGTGGGNAHNPPSVARCAFNLPGLLPASAVVASATAAGRHASWASCPEVPAPAIRLGAGPFLHLRTMSAVCRSPNVDRFVVGSPVGHRKTNRDFSLDPWSEQREAGLCITCSAWGKAGAANSQSASRRCSTVMYGSHSTARVSAPDCQLEIIKGFGPLMGLRDAFSRDVWRFSVNSVGSPCPTTVEKHRSTEESSDGTRCDPSLALVTRGSGKCMEIHIKDNAGGVPPTSLTRHSIALSPPSHRCTRDWALLSQAMSIDSTRMRSWWNPRLGCPAI